MLPYDTCSMQEFIIRMKIIKQKKEHGTLYDVVELHFYREALVITKMIRALKFELNREFG